MRAYIYADMDIQPLNHSLTPHTHTCVCVCARVRKHQNDVNILKKEVINVKRRAAEAAEQAGKVSAAFAYRCEDCFPSLCSNMEFWR